jgi:hypothetical protein
VTVAVFGIIDGPREPLSGHPYRGPLSVVSDERNDDKAMTGVPLDLRSLKRRSWPALSGSRRALKMLGAQSAGILSETASASFWLWIDHSKVVNPHLHRVPRNRPLSGGAPIRGGNKALPTPARQNALACEQGSPLAEGILN